MKHVPSCRLLGGLTLAVAAGVTGWALSAAPMRKAPSAPRRIVSLNLCADQLVVALADRDQIAGLTHNAADPHMSAVAAQVLAADPDLMIGMPVRRNPAIAVLKARHYPALDLKGADSYDAILTSIRNVAKAVGHPARGEALIAQMDADLRHIGKVPPGRIAAYYQRRGYLTGTGTLIDDLMQRVGLINLAGTLGRPSLSQMRLEEVVAARPDYLIVDSATDRVTDQGTEMMHHPALQNIKRIGIPQAWTVCGGPAYVKAARAMAQAAT
jgi:iron complex transport system substrate-binding protein